MTADLCGDHSLPWWSLSSVSEEGGQRWDIFFVVVSMWINTLQSTKYTVFLGGTLGTFFSMSYSTWISRALFLQQSKCEGPWCRAAHFSPHPGPGPEAGATATAGDLGMPVRARFPKVRPWAGGGPSEPRCASSVHSPPSQDNGHDLGIE